MYAVKADGKNGFGYYDPTLQQAVLDKVLLEQELRRALQNAELEMYYQPQMDLELGRIVGVEALMRWNHPQRGTLLAGTFLPLAEEMGLMVPLSDWMVGAVCRDLQALRREGHYELRMSVNLSPTCLAREEFLRNLWHTLEAHQIPAPQLELEITENVCIRNPETAMLQLNRLSALGLRIAIDDFGTGYSSLAYLQRFPVHTLKIDQAFVREINQADGHFPVVLAIIAMAKGLGVDVIAEGVESESQARYLRQAGSHVMQGFLFHRPLPLPALRRLLAQQDQPARELVS
jgi:EAL domain-containing protein (putative c-di-GMP-specific phosphodiesterase class I)